MAGKRCAREGCRAWARRGEETCRAHTSVSVSATPAARPAGPDRARAGEVGARAAAFRQRMAGGNYRDLLAREVAQIITQAGREGSLIEEIGALRVVLTRLLDEEDDPRRLAESIPRVVGATVRALKTQRTIDGETAGDLTEALTRILLEMGLGE